MSYGMSFERAINDLHTEGRSEYARNHQLLDNVPWDYHAFCSEEHPILFTTGLSSCIGLYCLVDNEGKEQKLPFGYLYHIWTNILIEAQMKSKLLQLKKSIIELPQENYQKRSFRMGLVYGDGQEEAVPYHVFNLEETFERLYKDLNQSGIKVKKDTPSYISRIVIIDPKNKGLVLSKNATIKQ